MAHLIYKDLSYQIVGVLYKVYNELGGGYQEKYYQRAVSLELKRENIVFKEQIKINLAYHNQVIGKYYLDFLINNKIVLELKVAPIFYSRDIKQVLGYLKATDLKLGILASFNRRELIYKRIIN